MIGRSLGHYQIVAKLGEGGMGEVYRARDTTLDRDVALKVLPEAFTADPDRLARFEREAKVLASLNHPNIGTIYGLEEAEGVKALVLELVEGPTLADRIERGPIPVDEAVPIAKQIADALEAAHEQGVIHRDLKPANVKVKADGTVKVLDFGLAKALDTTPVGDPSQSPTLTAAATQMGVIMGTAAYMSPEQARGRPVDKRTDIWALGVVMVEMLTGRRVFDGEDVSMTLSSVLQREPDWSLLPVAMPPALLVFLKRCLEKDPKRRVHDVADLRLALEGAFDSPANTRNERARRPVHRQPLAQAALVGLAGLVVGAVIARVVTSNSDEPSRDSVTRFGVSGSPASSPHIPMALSPDGETLVYVARNGDVDQLFRRSMDALEPTPITGTEGAEMPFFSPDGQAVGFFASGSLKTVSLAGGVPSTLCPAQGTPGGASWSANGTIVFQLYDGGLQRVSAAGGEPEPLTNPDDDDDVVGHVWPSFLPGGRAVLFTPFGGTGRTRVDLLALDSGERRTLIEGFNASYVSTGHIVFGRENGLWAVPFSLDDLDVTGPAFPILEDVEVRDNGETLFAASMSGSLAHVPRRAGMAARSLVWVDRQGQEEATLGDAGPYESVRISPDGRRVAVDVVESSNPDVWLFDLERGGNPTRFTFDAAHDGNAVWSPDGQSLVFSSDREGETPNLFRKSSDNTGDVEPLTVSDNVQAPLDFTPDGRSVLFAERQGSSLFSFAIGMLSIDSEPTIDWLLEAELTQSYAAVSPDGRWLAYSYNDSGVGGAGPEVYLRQFPNVTGGGVWKISNRGGGAPVWGPGSDEIFYLETRPGLTSVMRVQIETDGSVPPSLPTVLFEGPYLQQGYRFRDIGVRGRPYDISPDGERFLMIRTVASTDSRDAPDIVVVRNGLSELTQRGTDGSR